MTYKFTACNEKSYKMGRGGEKIRYIVIHYTANDGDTAKNNADYFARAAVEASAHYFVDENEIVQSVRDSNTAWHCGAKKYVHPECRNANSLGIEICSCMDASGRYYFKEGAVKRASALTSELMAKYSVPIENVIRHYDVTGKVCPAPFVLDSEKWLSFKVTLVGAEKTKSEEINDFVWELAERGIISNKSLWLKKAAEDINCYWLIKKVVDYIKGKEI